MLLLMFNDSKRRQGKKETQIFWINFDALRHIEYSLNVLRDQIRIDNWPTVNFRDAYGFCFFIELKEEVVLIPISASPYILRQLRYVL